MAPRPAPQQATGARAAGPLTPTIFHERWWLESVTDGRFEAAEVRHAGRLVGWLPYVASRRYLFPASVMPDLTHLLGPAIDEGPGSSNTRWLRRIDIVSQLAGQLPRFGLFSQTCHPGITDVLGFQACGFETSVQFSAEIAPAPQEALWRAMRDKTRNVIRRAGERSTLESLADPHEFMHFYQHNLARAGQRSYFDLGRIVRIYEAAHARDRALMLTVRDARRDTVAAVLYVWDAQRMWYLLSSRDARQTDNGAVSWLVWDGIRQAASRGLIFDFDGVASNGSARFFAGFGATLRPRFAIHRMSPAFGLGKSLLAWLRRKPNRNHFVAP